MTGHWTILQHVDWEGPGLIAAEAQGRGLRTDIRRLDLGADVPEHDEIQGLIVMGGSMGVYETDKYPFLAGECSLIAELVRRDHPVLGVCLGAQLLAKALGGRVLPGHGPETGFGFVELTAEGKRDAVFGPNEPPFPYFIGMEIPSIYPQEPHCLLPARSTCSRRSASEAAPMACSSTLSRT